jgi:hypothetical protein
VLRLYPESVRVADVKAVLLVLVKVEQRFPVHIVELNLEVELGAAREAADNVVATAVGGIPESELGGTKLANGVKRRDGVQVDLAFWPSGKASNTGETVTLGDEDAVASLGLGPHESAVGGFCRDAAEDTRLFDLSVIEEVLEVNGRMGRAGIEGYVGEEVVHLRLEDFAAAALGVGLRSGSSDRGSGSEASESEDSSELHIDGVWRGLLRIEEEIWSRLAVERTGRRIRRGDKWKTKGKQKEKVVGEL